ncbi:ABC transporter substrate-binding protein [Rummeliibacillus suwonensis]|uniref:ABC transporter substrate-binding protein n=1 Tax=Rummeliibacillus suwonensis TaxID=1306154 RepID=UPI001AAEBDB4|nr:ABC transporter substrate-binding protein [Rummeliibacillus suwonensis]MBO2536881.1 ABC transporter substrate-binding protein [Rummeliibacillus suwonensis]
MENTIKSKTSKLLFGLLIIGLLAGCGAGKEDKTSSTLNGGTKNKAYELTVGYGQGSGATLFNIAEHEGFFADENLRVKGVGFASSADGLNALEAKKVDLGMTFGTAAPLTFISKGSDFSIIGGHLEGGHPILVKEENKDKYKTLEDYKGKKVGTIRMFTSDIVFRSALSEAGIDWKKDLKIIEFKTGGDLLQALSSGKVDVAVSAGSTFKMAQESGLVPIAWSNDLNPTHVCCRIVTQSEYLKVDGGEAYKRFLKALIRAERVKNEQPQIAVAAAKKYYKFDDKTVDSIVNEEHSHYSPDPNSHEVVKMWEQMKDIGYIKNAEKINIKDHIRTSLYKKALNELIKEYPDDKTYYEDLLTRFNKQNS